MLALFCITLTNHVDNEVKDKTLQIDISVIVDIALLLIYYFRDT